MKYPERKNFSIVRFEGRYRIQCDDTSEFVTEQIKSKKKAKQALRNHVNTLNFIEESTTLTKEEILNRMKIFVGRLRPKKKPWTLEEARLVASVYETRGELYTENQKCYLAAYQKGWLDEICNHMKPSRKKNKFVYGVLNPNVALSKIFDYKTHHEFAVSNQSAYEALRRFGVDTVELFENLDSATYLKDVIKKLADDAIYRFTKNEPAKN